MKVPNNYVRSKCCHAYQDPSNTICVRCGEPFQAEEAVEHRVHTDAVDSAASTSSSQADSKSASKYDA